MLSTVEGAGVEGGGLHAHGCDAEPGEPLERGPASDGPGREVQTRGSHASCRPGVDGAPMGGDAAATKFQGRGDRRRRQVLCIQPARPRRREARHPLQGRRLERRDDRIRQRRSATGGKDPHRRAPVIALQLHVQEGSARDGAEHGCEARDTQSVKGHRGQLIRPLWPALDALKGVVVEEDRYPICGAPHIELQAIATGHRQGRQQRRERVFRSAAPVASMGESKGATAGRHEVPPISSCAQIPRWSLG